MYDKTEERRIMKEYWALIGGQRFYYTELLLACETLIHVLPLRMTKLMDIAI